MPIGLFTMSTQEIERVTVIRQVVGKHLKQRQAMRLLKLSKRQVIRLVKKYRKLRTRVTLDYKWVGKFAFTVIRGVNSYKISCVLTIHHIFWLNLEHDRAR